MWGGPAERAADALEGGLPERQTAGLRPGDVVEPFPVVDGAGRTSTIRFGDGEAKTILLVFSSTCSACEQTLPLWRETFGSGAPTTVRILALQMDQPDPGSFAPGASPLALPFPVYGREHSSSDPIARVPFIPAAVVVDPKGVVTKVWFGVPTDEQAEELRRELTVG